MSDPERRARMEQAKADLGPDVAAAVRVLKYLGDRGGEVPDIVSAIVRDLGFDPIDAARLMSKMRRIGLVTFQD